MARLMVLLCAACLIAACGSPQRYASAYYAKGVKYYYFDAPDESQEFFQRSADTGYVLPGAYASMAVALIKQGRIDEGLSLLDKEYELYRDPLVKDYIAFIRERFELDPAPQTPATPAEAPTPAVTVPAEPSAPVQPVTEPAPAAGGGQ